MSIRCIPICGSGHNSNLVTLPQLEPVDILFLALPHGQAQNNIEEYAKLGTKIIDLSADFRLRDADLYEKWYGEKHAAPEWLSKFVYGLARTSPR